MPGLGTQTIFAAVVILSSDVRFSGFTVEHAQGEGIFSGGTPVALTIARNHIFDNAIGIWLSKPVTAFGLLTNTFTNVTTPISANH